MLFIFAQSFLCFFASLVLVADYNAGDLRGSGLPMLSSLGRILRSALEGIRIGVGLYR